MGYQKEIEINFQNKNCTGCNCTFLLFVLMLMSASNSVLPAKREYWIAADEVVWDYAPSFPINLMSGKEFTPEQLVL